LRDVLLIASDRNLKGAGRKGQDFISYLKAFLLAPVLRVEQNSKSCEILVIAECDSSIGLFRKEVLNV
jgi:hypothetical protein